MVDDDVDLPPFPESIAPCVGEPLGAGGTQKICLPFCISIWYGQRRRPWGSTTICGPSMEEIQRLADFLVQQAAALGFRCRAVQGECPAT